MDCLKQAELAVSREVMDRKAAPRRVGRLRAAGQRRDEVAMIELDLEGHARFFARVRALAPKDRSRDSG
jgi:hypothetical protein